MARNATRSVGLLSILLASGFVGLAGAAPNQDVLQPGDRVNDICTLNFVYDGVGALAGRVYIGTAAHCLDAVGQIMSSPNFPNFGAVAFIREDCGDPGAIGGGTDCATENDYAFIEVKPEFHPFVVADMRGHVGQPTGVATAGQTTVGDLTQFSGWGTGFMNTAVGREQRVGVLTSDNARMYVLEGPITPGDSGGPVVHIETGRALGVVSRIVAGCCALAFPVWNEGPTVSGLILDASVQGFTVQLRSA